MAARNSQYIGGSGTNPSVPARGETVSQAPTETMKGPENVCAARKNISCYQYDVENIALVTPKPPEGGQVGWNQINLIFGEVPFDNPMDFGSFSMACVRAWYQSADGGKLPATGKLEVPEIAWHDPKDFARSYEATSTDQGTGKMACGTGKSGAVYCNPGDACVSTGLRRCRLVGCLCPDGTFGLCATPNK